MIQHDSTRSKDSQHEIVRRQHDRLTRLPLQQTFFQPCRTLRQTKSNGSILSNDPWWIYSTRVQGKSSPHRSTNISSLATVAHQRNHHSVSHGFQLPFPHLSPIAQVYLAPTAIHRHPTTSSTINHHRTIQPSSSCMSSTPFSSIMSIYGWQTHPTRTRCVFSKPHATPSEPIN